MCQAIGDLHTLVRVERLIFQGLNSSEGFAEVGAIGERFDRDFRRIEFGATRRDIGQFGLPGWREDGVDFQVVQVQPRIPK